MTIDMFSILYIAAAGLTLTPYSPVDTTVDSGFGSQETDTPAVANDWAAQLSETDWNWLMRSHQADKVLPNASQWRTAQLYTQILYL